MRTRTGLELPRLGQGTWRMGEVAARRDEEIAALCLGLDLGIGLIDTAEMYGDGGAEGIVAEAIRGRRDDVQIVSKVLPHHASFEGTLRAAERSLERLGTDRIDLYLLHWPGQHPLDETYAAFQRLVEQGKLLHYGVSNFDREAMERSEQTRGGNALASNQVLYNLDRRGIESGLLPWCRARDINVMAYSPFEQGNLSRNRTLAAVARRHGCTPYQIALAWTMRDPGVTAIPKAVKPEHVRENVAALEIRLDERDRKDLNRAFPEPTREVPLAVL